MTATESKFHPFVMNRAATYRHLLLKVALSLGKNTSRVSFTMAIRFHPTEYPIHDKKKKIFIDAFLVYE